MDYQAEEYLVVTSDEAELELNTAYLSLLQKSYHSSLRWFLGARAAIDSLSMFPRRCPLAREDAFFPNHEVRQLLYGTGHNAYRIIFIIFEEDAEVRVIQFRHGAQQSKHKLQQDNN